MPRAARQPVDLGRAVVEAFATNERINQLLLESLAAEVWRADPPDGKGRSVAAIVAHIHNVRHMWLKVSAKTPPPAKLDRHRVTREQAVRALASSAAAMCRLLEDAVTAGGYVKDFRPDVVGFLAYAVAHEAHHRGQIALLARQLGHPLSQEAGYAMWDWSKRWKECGPA